MELVNATDADISLFSTTVNKGWKIEGIGFEFTSSSVIPAHGRILLIPENLEDISIDNWGPELVRTSYGVPADVQIFTYTGKLSNRGETIAVKEPFSKEGVGVDAKFFYTWHDATSIPMHGLVLQC